MSPFWRNLLITVVVAGAAGALGGWLGAERHVGIYTKIMPLRQSVHQIVREGLNLNPAQTKQIQDIEKRYYKKRTELRAKIALANKELANALIADMSFGREAQTASLHVQQALGELQNATILYVLEVRDVLTPEQQTAYDRKVREALSASDP